MSCTSSRRLQLRHKEVANIFHQELTVKWGLSNGPPILCCKHKPQSLLENNYKLYYGRCLITVRNVHNNRADTIVLHKTTKHALNRCSKSR